MTQAATITEFACPGCASALAPSQPGATTCLRCGWKGEVYLFAPIAVQSSAAESALPDEATCIHHPSKKATAVCAGTGDYICSLCAIEVEGQTYSAQYIDATGRQKLKSAFAQTFPRPDRRIIVYLAMLLVPYLDAIFAVFAFLWVPHGFILYARALRMRRENPLFRRVMGMTSVILLPILLALAGIGWLAMVGTLLYYWQRGWR